MDQLQASSSIIPFDSTETTSEENPFTAPDEKISELIIGIHDAIGAKCDVEQLFNAVSNVIKSSVNISNLERPKNAELVEDTCDFMPPFTTLKEIACEMTCKHFNKSTAHQTIVAILEKLRSYTWDAKAVIALSAFALDYGETWRLSHMKLADKNTVKLHIFKLGEEEESNEDHINLIRTSVEDTLKLIEYIIELEKTRADLKICVRRNVPTLQATPRELYTYWAILALLACANQKFELDWDMRSEVFKMLKFAVTRVNGDLTRIREEIASTRDLTWRLEVINSPSGILQLLKALIFHEDTQVQQLEIFEYTSETQAKPVGANELKRKNLLLFISGLYNIEEHISVLTSIHGELKIKNYQILWIPMGNKYDEAEKKEFNERRSKMAWYVLQDLFEIKGRKLMETEWHYMGKPMVVVVNTRGEVVHMNALYMISTWKMEAFPFRTETEDKLFQNWKWFWKPITTAYKQVTKSKLIDEKNNYILIYGGTDTTIIQKFDSLINGIKKASIGVKDFNLQKACGNEISEFWKSINILFLSRVQRENYEHDSILRDIRTVLSFENLKGWAILSQGKKVLVLGDYNVMIEALQIFKGWKVSDQKQEFVDYYKTTKVESAGSPCHEIELSNVNSRIPISMACSEPSCHLSMVIDVVKYKCCHGQASDVNQA
ncbi:protein SIEVE ELEMENT OCCLUSION B-like [Prosopis cineraria]|uniref:protein SIEVE ELEMENT OCCLUSION B-like n=1 Tax=Prosopis cineraria TaxID=364024 RepID=UPI00240F92EE|nr:protein SIEVE ELEMENT OCCLUSION B-like [Prosopis cineraria]